MTTVSGGHFFHTLPNWHHETFAVGLVLACARSVPDFGTGLAKLLAVDDDWEQADAERGYTVDGRPRRYDLRVGAGTGGAVVEAKRWSWFGDGQLPDAAAWAVKKRLGRLIVMVPEEYERAAHERLTLDVPRAAHAELDLGVVTWDQVAAVVRNCLASAATAEARTRLGDLDAYLASFLQRFRGFTRPPSVPRDLTDTVSLREYRWFLDEIRWRVALDWKDRHREIVPSEGQWSAKGDSAWAYTSAWRPCSFGDDGSQGWVGITEYRREGSTTVVHVEMSRTRDDSPSAHVASVALTPEDVTRGSARLPLELERVCAYLRDRLAYRPVGSESADQSGAGAMYMLRPG